MKNLQENMLLKISRRLLGCLLTWIVICLPLSVHGQGLKLRDICRLKGQESNVLQGFGLVVGLRGTGDGESVLKGRSLARMIQLLGGQMPLDSQGRIDATEIADAKNVALVMVSVQVPPVGAQQGDQLDVVVNALNAKSLEGGFLTLTPLRGPNIQDTTAYAMASGPLQVDANGSTATGVIPRGAKMESSIAVPFENNGKITLVIDRDYADFDTSQLVEETINKAPETRNVQVGSGEAGDGISPGFVAARAIDQVHVEVLIPPTYRDHPIIYISGLLEAPITLNPKSNRVVINEREKIVIIGENVEIAPALVTLGNLRIEAAAGGGNQFIPLDPSQPQGQNPKLKALADALNALDVPTEDLIAIIKTLKKKGDLYGEVVFQ